MAIIEADAAPQTPFERDVADTQKYFDSPRFDGIIRLYTARQVVEQRGAIPTDYTVARDAAAAFHPRLRELFAQKKSITTFGPYSPGQAVVMKRMGIEGIYLGGWATSAKGSISEDPGPDLASYPLSQVPDEAAGLVRALLTADRNQQYLRLRMTERATRRDARMSITVRSSSPTPTPATAVIPTCATSFAVSSSRRARVPHRGPAARHEEVRPSGRQGSGASDEQIKRLNTARFQLDIMRVPGIIVARTDAEAANLLDSRADERDQPFLLGATNLKIPSYKACFLAMMRQLLHAGVTESTAICSTRFPTASTPPPTRGCSATASRRDRRGRQGVAGQRRRFGRRAVRQGRVASSSTPGRSTPACRPMARPSGTCSTSARGRASRRR